MKRIIRTRRLTPEEIACLETTRQQIDADLPDLINQAKESREMEPVKLADAWAGDSVVCLTLPSSRHNGCKPLIKIAKVTRAGSERLCVGDQWFSRKGLPVRKADRHRLSDPTPELLQQLADAGRRQEETKQKIADQEIRDERDWQDAITWLSGTTDRDRIATVLWASRTSIIDDLKRHGILS